MSRRAFASRVVVPWPRAPWGLLLAALGAGATAAFWLPHRRVGALDVDDEGYQRLTLHYGGYEDGDEPHPQDAIVFEDETEDEEKEEEVEAEELLPAARVQGVRRARPASEEEKARRQEMDARLQERIRSWPQFEAICSQEEDEENGPKVVLRYPPWMEKGEAATDVALFNIVGASPRGQEDGVVDMISMLSTTPQLTRRQDLYQFHQGMREEIGKQAHIVKPRMRWVVAGRPALGFITAYTGWGKTLVSTYVITAYQKTGYVLVFNSVHDAETPLAQCLARHQQENEEYFDYVLRSVRFRPNNGP